MTVTPRASSTTTAAVAERSDVRSAAAITRGVLALICGGAIVVLGLIAGGHAPRPDTVVVAVLPAASIPANSPASLDGVRRTARLRAASLVIFVNPAAGAAASVMPSAPASPAPTATDSTATDSTGSAPTAAAPAAPSSGTPSSAAATDPALSADPTPAADPNLLAYMVVSQPRGVTDVVAAMPPTVRVLGADGGELRPGRSPAAGGTQVLIWGLALVVFLLILAPIRARQSWRPALEHLRGGDARPKPVAAGGATRRPESDPPQFRPPTQPTPARATGLDAIAGDGSRPAVSFPVVGGSVQSGPTSPPPRSEPERSEPERSEPERSEPERSEPAPQPDAAATVTATQRVSGVEIFGQHTRGIIGAASLRQCPECGSFDLGPDPEHARCDRCGNSFRRSAPWPAVVIKAQTAAIDGGPRPTDRTDSNGDS